MAVVDEGVGIVAAGLNRWSVVVMIRGPWVRVKGSDVAVKTWRRGSEWSRYEERGSIM